MSDLQSYKVITGLDMLKHWDDIGIFLSKNRILEFRCSTLEPVEVEAYTDFSGCTTEQHIYDSALATQDASRKRVTNIIMLGRTIDSMKDRVKYILKDPNTVHSWTYFLAAKKEQPQDENPGAAS